MRILLRSSVVFLVAGACARQARRATSAERPPSPSNESRASARADSTQEFRGEWDAGFETSTFRGCNGTVFSNVWLTLAPGATTGVRWPNENPGGRHTFTYYVRVRGILRGPADHRRVGGYGHLGSADYELLVTRLLEVKLPGEPNCVVRR